MRFVPIKTDDQLDLQALHRVRDRLMVRRTSVINQLRAFLLERGLVFAKSPVRLREAIPEVLENANENLIPRIRKRPRVETIEAHEREESAYQAYMNIHRSCTDCSRTDPD
jgi:hypothetical protein